MRLTRRGGDYLKASAVTAIISTILDVRIAIALALAMVVAALTSQILLATSSRRNISMRMDNSHVTVFKEEQALGRLAITSRRRRFVSVEVSSVEGPEGIEVRVIERTPDYLTLSFVPRCSGRFQGLVATFVLKDPLQLFHKSIEFSKTDFIIDSLPRSLVTEIKVARPMSLTLGERAGRTRGSGQEFYAVDEYHPETEKKDILWKKVARLPGDQLVARIRESNIPKTLRIGVIKSPRGHTNGANNKGENQLLWMDIACEGAGALGKMLISIGCDVELVYAVGTDNGVGILTSYALDLSELSTAIMEMSVCSLSDSTQAAEIILQSDISITGMKDLEHEPLAREVSKKPALLVEEAEASPYTVGEIAVIYSGTEDVSRLIYAVISR